MSGRWTFRSNATLAALVFALAAPAARAEDSLVHPERIETARDERRLTTNVEVSASAAKDRFDLLEPIRLEVRAENVSVHHEGLPVTGALPEAYYQTFWLRVFDAEGRLLPKTRYYEDVPYRRMPIGMSNGSAGLVFSPGQEVSGKVVANLAYDMTRPGNYTILVEYRVGRTEMIDGQEVPIFAQSEPIEVEVVAEPPRLIP